MTVFQPFCRENIQIPKEGRVNKIIRNCFKLGLGLGLGLGLVSGLFGNLWMKFFVLYLFCVPVIFLPPRPIINSIRQSSLTDIIMPQKRPNEKYPRRVMHLRVQKCHLTDIIRNHHHPASIHSPDRILPRVYRRNWPRIAAVSPIFPTRWSRYRKCHPPSYPPWSDHPWRINS